MLPNCLLTHLAREQALAVMEEGAGLGSVRRKWDSARWREATTCSLQGYPDLPNLSQNCFSRSKTGREV